MGTQVEVLAELAANVWQVHIEVGQRIEEGAVVVILESMKMEIPVESPCSGTVTTLNVAPESQVQDGDVIAVITTD
jgi:biotin carboxyl carrier protein